MRTVTLSDGTEVHCLQRFEALAMDQHVCGYLKHGIEARPGDVVLDVGANIGLFALRVAQRCQQDVTIYAFEPIPEIAEVLRRNVSDCAEGRVEVLEYGLSRQRGSAEFTYFYNSPGLSTAEPGLWTSDPGALEKTVRGGVRKPPVWWGRFIPTALSGVIARRLLKRSRTVTCELRTVSDVLEEHGIERVDLLKMDIEGGELDVLLGIAADDWPKVRQVVTEVHDIDGRLETVISLLKENGLTRMVVDQEPFFADTWLYNVYARR
jgi:FkbM family methyltransferase